MASPYLNIETTSSFETFTLTDVKGPKRTLGRLLLEQYLSDSYSPEFSAYIFRSFGKPSIPEHNVSISFQISFVQRIVALERQKKETT